MRIVLYTGSISPHQIPFCRALIKRIGASQFRYVYTQPLDAQRVSMGWDVVHEPWILHQGTREAQEWLEMTDVVISGIRDFGLFERRAARGLSTFYTSERWFKPIRVGIRGWGLGFNVTGRVRMLIPRYRRMVKALVTLAERVPSFRLLPIGVHARDDFLRMGISEDKLMTWGYFVAPSASSIECKPRTIGPILRVLWVGRMIDWKRVDTIIKAVGCCRNVELTLVGNGIERGRLVRLAQGMPVSFVDSLPISRIREQMRQHDVYVLSSDGGEGWGAVVNEALEEGMIVLGTRESGAGATVLRKEYQFSAGNVEELKQLLQKARDGQLSPQGIGVWSAEQGAERFLSLVNECRKEA